VYEHRRRLRRRVRLPSARDRRVILAGGTVRERGSARTRVARFDHHIRGNSSGVDESKNVTGTRLTCTNADCECELQINTPCPHGNTYMCACGHPLESVS
jgi:hypothetical protein